MFSLLTILQYPKIHERMFSSIEKVVGIQNHTCHHTKGFYSNSRALSSLKAIY
jgi:hypothetical protein